MTADVPSSLNVTPNFKNRAGCEDRVWGTVHGERDEMGVVELSVGFEVMTKLTLSTSRIGVCDGILPTVILDGRTVCVCEHACDSD